jgi:uncharacterized protein (TIGR02285 family)
VLNQFHQNNLDIAVGVYREDVRQAFIPNWFLDTEYPITVFYNPKATKINDVSDIKDLRVSWKRGYHFELFVSDIKDIYLVNSTKTGFDLLNKNRVDAFIDYPKNIPQEYMQRLVSFELVPSRHIYLAFQKSKKGELLAKQFDEKMNELRSLGELAKIFGNEYEHSGLGGFDTNLIQMIVITRDLGVLNQGKNMSQESIESNVFNLIRAQLEKYSIEFKVHSSLEDIEQSHKEKNVCFNNMLKTDGRTKNFIFSKPSYFHMGLRLYSKTDLNLSDSIDLISFLQSQPKAKLGITAQQSYGVEIARQLSHIDQAQIVHMPVNQSSKFTLFQSGKFDFMLQYPEIVNSIWTKVDGDKLYSYTIKNVNKYVTGHMMCNKTNVGENFISAYNRALHKTIKSGIFFDIHYRAVDKNSQKDFLKYFEEAFSH